MYKYVYVCVYVRIFSMLETKAHKDVFCWNPSGTSFLVKDTTEFTKVILPKYFKHCNFASFVRQLNKYDFHKVRSNKANDTIQKLNGDQVWEFEHTSFKRDRKDLLKNIKRKATKKKIKAEDDDTIDDDMVRLESASFSPNIITEDNDDDVDYDELLRLTRNLQSEIDELKQSHVNLETTITHINKKEELILNEFSFFRNNMKAKDELLKECMKLNQEKVKIEKVDIHPSSNHNTSWNEQQRSTTMATPLESLLTDIFLPTPTPPPPPPHFQQQQQNALDNTTVSSSSISAVKNSQLHNENAIKTSNNVSSLLTLNPPTSHLAQHIPTSISSQVSNIPYNDKGKKRMLVNWATPPRILLVDDDAVYRDMCGRMLNMVGCSINLAKNGIEALHKLSHEKFDLILMDIVMPEMDGIATTRNIRRYDSLTPIVSMTSNFSHDDILQYIGIGMNDILPKPFSKNTLYDILEKHCAHLKITNNQEEKAATAEEEEGEEEREEESTINNKNMLMHQQPSPPTTIPSLLLDNPTSTSSKPSSSNHYPFHHNYSTISTTSQTIPAQSNHDPYWQSTMLNNKKLTWSSLSQQQQQQPSKRHRLNDLYDTTPSLY
ncbi:uncharacterized protein BX663DRAFT_428245 [Cokeromyces recurvatus]|uniref:uncharacterized protein n=1 Tax=Cokeromyces recurvatus TaxID=90255 RepID=UPI002220BDF2|nr:uncharacterized protein BX663DRAFT_428245 [Cokeromyces recurvatus]KAI7906030.1 hypothetical protein BX663DRAFT_428245 [Cokeromyces recurvatus]